jgi:hypothetical protein
VLLLTAHESAFILAVLMRQAHALTSGDGRDDGSEGEDEGCGFNGGSGRVVDIGVREMVGFVKW